MYLILIYNKCLCDSNEIDDKIVLKMISLSYTIALIFDSKLHNSARDQ